jgi:hypothetical protein
MNKTNKTETPEYILEEAKKWKEIGEEFNLQPWELKEVVYHLKRIEQLITKK